MEDKNARCIFDTYGIEKRENYLSSNMYPKNASSDGVDYFFFE